MLATVCRYSCEHERCLFAGPRRLRLIRTTACASVQTSPRHLAMDLREHAGTSTGRRSHRPHSPTPSRISADQGYEVLPSDSAPATVAARGSLRAYGITE